MGALTTIGTVTITLLIGIAASLLAYEFVLSAPLIARWLVRKAAARLPLDQRVEYEAEWLQLIADIESPSAKILHAAHLNLRTVSIASSLDEIAISQRLAVRSLDIFFSAFLLWLMGPVLVLIAASIKLSDGGPIIYRRTLVGRYGEQFGFFSFRTATRAEGSVKITRVGRVLRRLSLDLLPSLINILRGHMSFVGPSAGREGASDPRLQRYRPGLVSPIDPWDSIAADDFVTNFGAKYWLRTIWRGALKTRW